MSEENNIAKNLVAVNIESEMEKSYIDYAMSVIAGRALPDVRDGLKPVHRRILYSMNELGVTADKAYRKSARIVGDVLGKYHPHGDTSVYDAMVRLAQEFSTRYLLVDGHGNFGSIDGDGAAAMRYTEARMAKITEEMLRDIEKETVDLVPNFDDTLKEPSVLPARFPNLLVNGSSGIAVGMATNIPPHNLKEVIDGVVKVIDNPETTDDELIETIKGPDFPTGGIIVGKSGIREAYKTGKGRITVRSVADIEPMNNGKSKIIVTEIPYQVNKARLIEKIADLVKEKKIDGITDLRDESDRDGMRIVIELRKDVNPQVILNKLYKMTQLQDTFSIIMLALVKNKPRVLTLRQVIDCYLEHQRDVIVRRTSYDLRKAEARKHIVEGLLIALDHIDEVIKLIRSSKTDAEAKEGLMSKFGLSEIQSQAILDMRLKRLTGLERSKLDAEYKDLLEKIARYNEILSSEMLVNQIIKNEMLAIRDKYSDDRKTQIKLSEEEFDIEDLIQEEEMAVTMTHFGYIKRISLDVYQNQNRGGKGKSGLATRQEDYVTQLFVASTHNTVLFFTNRGRVFKLKVYEIPEAGRQAKGTPIVNLLNITSSEKITAVVPVKNVDDELNYVTMITKKGIVKKTTIEQFSNIRKNGLIAITLREEDKLIECKMTTGKDELIVVTENGKAIRFPEENIRPMGRGASGVKAMNLSATDKIVAMEIAETDKEILTVTEKGYGKRTLIDEYRSQNRNGSGIINYKVTEKTGKVVGAKVVDETNDLLLISSDGTVMRTKICDISQQSRSTQGVTIMKLGDNDSIVSIEKIIDDGKIEDELGQNSRVDNDTINSNTTNNEDKQ